MVFENHSQDTRYNAMGETCQTVSATWGMGGNNQPLEVKPQQAVVRRLTPTECTRLQGFPDGWCDIGDWVDSNGKKHKDSDSPKYKALGNSIALPYWDWMAERMVNQLKKSGVQNPTMASLFDGIAGFPYVYIRHGCMPLWTSEIEEYPIAVCKKHFGDADTREVGDIEEYLKLPPNWVTSNKPRERESN
jgi:DNA (cytosine-5)-methyltransferase 1